MNKLNLALKITNWCNLNCAHCSECSGPRQPKSLMPMDTVSEYISQFQDIRMPRWEHLVFTGGESLAPYFFGEYEYVPQCMDLTHKYNMVPFFKTNGMWGANKRLRERILGDMADNAHKHGRLNSLDISLDEFHDNVAPVAAILGDVFHDYYLAQAIRISLVGLDTQKSRNRLIELMSQVCARRISFKPLDNMTLLLGNGEFAGHVYFGFFTPVSIAGRAAKNNLGTAINNGMPDAKTGSCFQIDNNDVATLNYKWRTPVAGRPLNTVVAKLFEQMNTR